MPSATACTCAATARSAVGSTSSPIRSAAYWCVITTSTGTRPISVAGAQLGKGEESVPLKLGRPAFEFAVIAGNRTIDPVTSAVLENPDDGRVSVADTRLEGMSDFRVLPVSHAYIMQDEEVIRLVITFLADGRFPPEEP